jgi:hypothetical protein
MLTGAPEYADRRGGNMLTGAEMSRPAPAALLSGSADESLEKVANAKRIPYFVHRLPRPADQ